MEIYHSNKSSITYPLDAHPDLRHIAAKLLAQGQGGRVLGVGSADLDDVVKLLRLGVQSIMKLPEMNTNERHKIISIKARATTFVGIIK